MGFLGFGLSLEARIQKALVWSSGLELIFPPEVYINIPYINMDFAVMNNSQKFVAPPRLTQSLGMNPKAPATANAADNGIYSGGSSATLCRSILKLKKFVLIKSFE